VWAALQGATELTDRRVKSDVSALQGAKVTQATGVLTVILEMLETVALLALMARRAIPVAQEGQVHPARTEILGQRAREGVLARPASLDRKENQVPLEAQGPKENQGDEETSGQRALKDQTELRESTVKWGQRD